MTSYSAIRDAEQLRYLQNDIASFILRYQSRPPGTKRKTLFLFPGGMGSKLLRARTPYQANGPSNQTFQYDTVWLTPLTFLGEALDLEMNEVNGVYQDLADRIIIPYGAVDLFGLTPYTQFTDWCEQNQIDWFVFGWDWRRRLEDTVDFFLNTFLPVFQSETQQSCPNALDDVVLLGHSFGGMVVNLILQQQSGVPENLTCAVTAASPFYGYDGQIHRWFEGMSWFFLLDKAKVVDVITSLPGVYVLPYLDLTTWGTYGNALQADPDYPLTTYPSHDAVNTALDIDPFNPGPNRYPQNTGFNWNELAYGLQTYRDIAAGPPQNYIGLFYNIRGVQPAPSTTPGSISWTALTGPNNPGTSPIGTGPGVPGDDTLPAWTTRLVTLPADQVQTVPVSDHMFMMEEPATQAVVGELLWGAEVTMAVKRLSPPRPVKPATREQVIEFLQGLHKFRREEGFIDEAGLNDYIESQSSGSLKSLARRIMMDLLKSPVAVTAPEKPGRRPPKPKAPAKKRPASKTTKKKKKTAPKKKTPKKTKRTAAKRGAAKTKKTAGRKARKTR